MRLVTLSTVEAFEAGRELMLREMLPLDEVGFIRGELSLSRGLCLEVLREMAFLELCFELLSETPSLELRREELREILFSKAFSARVDTLLSDEREAGLESLGGCGLKLTEWTLSLDPLLRETLNRAEIFEPRPDLSSSEEDEDECLEPSTGILLFRDFFDSSFANFSL